MDKLKEMTIGEKVIVAAAALLLLDSFLPWYSVDLGPLGTYSKNGWGAPDSGLSLLAILIGVAMGTLVALHRFEVVKLPDKAGPLPWGAVQAIAGGIAFLLIVAKWLGNTSYTSFGLYLGLLCTAGLAAGGILTAKEQGAIPTQHGSTA